MELSDLKQRIQDHFKDGLLLVVGSGLSVAEGIPGMGRLTEYLQEHVPHGLATASSANWNVINDQLDSGLGLESVLLAHPLDEELESKILEHTTSLMLEAEANVIKRVIAGKQTLRLSRLFKHMLKPNSGIPIVTTNYDRLIELSAELVGLGVDSLFAGNQFGKLDSNNSKFGLCQGLIQRRKSVHLKFAEHTVVLKPHGSLDWFLHNDEPIRCPLPLDLNRLIITPGLNKYRGGYDRPFDAHREPLPW